MEQQFSFTGSKNQLTLSAQKFKSLSQQGARYLKAGQFNQALTIFTQLHQAQPKNATVNYYLGYCLHALGEPEQAANHYKHAVTAKPALLEGWLNLANVYMLLEKYAAAKTAFKQAIKLDPKQTQALYGLGMAFGGLEDHASAAQALFSAYQLDKHSADIKNNLVTALIKAENYSQAIAVLESLPELESNQQLLNHYGIALLGAGKLDESESVLLKLHESEPDNQEIIYNLARLYQDQTQYEKSLTFFERLQDKDTDVKTLASIGAVLDSLGRFDEAEAVLQQALELNKEDVTVLNHLGNALTGGNKAQDAEQMYRRAIAIEGGSAMSHNNLGFALASLGRTDEAMAEYTKAIALKPDYGESYRNLVTVKKIKDPQAPLIDQMIEQIDFEGTPERDKIQFGFALGKALDDSAQYDRAFKYYKLANDLVAKSRPFNLSSFVEHVDNIIEVFSAEFFEQLSSPLGVDSDKSIFVVGMSRSGTTLAEKIVSSHPKVQAAGELGKLFEVIKTYEKGSSQAYPFCMSMPESQRLIGAAQEYLSYLDNYIKQPGLKHVVDKMPYNFAHLGFIALAMPNAKIIHCKRDPIDTCLSNYFQYFPRGISCLYDLEQLAGYYQQYLRLMAHWQQVLPIPVYELQYEALIENQETITHELIEFLGLEWDEACLTSHKTTSSVRTASIWQVRQPIYKKSVQRWRHYEKHIGILIDALEPK